MQNETYLVESLNSSMRDRLTRLKRKTKAYSKSQYMLEISINMWVNSDILFADLDKFCGKSLTNIKYNNLNELDNYKEKQNNSSLDEKSA